MSKPCTVIFFGAYESDYVRNRLLHQTFEAAGWRVRTIHAPLWERETDKTGAYLAPARLVLTALRLFGVSVGLALRLAVAPRPDLICTNYLGHTDTILARCVAALRWPLRRPPIMFNSLIILHDTFVTDRGLVREGSLPARALRLLDRLACASADRVVMDTPEHAAAYRSLLEGDPRKFVSLPIGAEPTVFAPSPLPPQPPLRIVFYGKFSPLHGSPTIIDALERIAEEPGWEATLIGGGQYGAEIAALAVRLPQVTHIPWVRYEELGASLAQAHVALGIFGNNRKAGRVVPNKVYSALAAGRALITARTPAIESILHDDQTALLVPPGDATALCGAILRLRDDPECVQRLGEAAAELATREWPLERQVERLNELLAGMGLG